MASALSYIRRYPSTSLRFGRDDSAGCRRGLSPARRHREISPFCPPPSSQALANLFAQAKIGNEAIVELAPAGIHFTETPGGSAIFGKGDKTPPIKSSSSTQRYAPAYPQTATARTRIRGHDKPDGPARCNNWKHQEATQPTSSPLRPCKNTCPDKATRTICDRSRGIAHCSSRAKR